jgi:hypothetical protein
MVVTENLFVLRWMDYAETITAERIKRVINGYGIVQKEPKVILIFMS